MRNFYITLLFSFLHWCICQYGAFYMAGNQLVPINETDISVKKEILYIKKTQEFAEVSVYYEFFNPKETKEIVVGFEAGSPSGVVDGAPINGHHPYMFDFTVSLNGNFLSYQVAYVADSLYAKNGKVESIDLKTFKEKPVVMILNFYVCFIIFKGKV